MRKSLTVVLIFLSFSLFAQRASIQTLTKNAPTSMRGLSIVDNQTIWVSGTKGYVGKSLDGGENWAWFQVKGFETLDFRDIHAFSKNNAVIVNAGSPAYVFYTIDGGTTWHEAYRNTDPAIFLDGMDFWDKNNGLIFGDPIKHKMQLLRTSDGGKTWNDISASLTIPLQEGEAGFAASGTSIKVLGKGNIWIATGGSASNIYYSKNYGKAWTVNKLPILQGKNSQGAFSIDFLNSKNGIVVGGDYQDDKRNDKVVFYTKDGGTTWTQPHKGTAGFRSSVIYANKSFCVATGTSGTDISYDGGNNWENISSESFNVVQAQHKVIIFAGANGKISLLVMR
jgi:photosystem II stability/assembly factor-like uncharacterized protein